MKKLFIQTFIIIFLANTYTLAAWAKPCMMGTKPAQTVEKMDCHEQQEQKNEQAPHCKDLCLCLHVSLNQTPTLQNVPALSAPMTAFNNRIESKDISLTTLITAPPRRPPRHFS